MPILQRSSSWQTKPPPGAVLDTVHPLSQGLVGAWIFNEQGGLTLWNYATNRTHSISLGDGDWTSRSLSFDPTSAPQGTFIQTDQITPTDRFTLIVRAGQRILLGGFIRLFSKRDSFEILHDGGSDTIRAQIFIGGTARLANIQADANMVAGQLYDFGMAWSGVGVTGGGTLRGFFNGVLNQATGFQTGTLDAGIGLPWIGRHDQNTTFNWDGEIAHAFLWLRELGRSEIADMYVNPYQMFVAETPKLMLYLSAPAGAVVQTDLTMPFQVLNRITADFSLPFDFSERQIRADFTLPLEIMEQIKADNTLPLEILSKITSDITLPVQLIAIEVIADFTLPVEILAKIQSNQTLPIEILSKVISDSTLPLDILNKIIADLTIPLQIQIKSISDFTLPVQIISSTSLVVADFDLPIAILQRINSDNLLPVEILSKITSDYTLTVQILTRPIADFSLPIENLTKVISDSTFTFQVLLRIISDSTLPVQVIFQTQANFTLPIENLAKITSDYTLPLMIGLSVIEVLLDEPFLQADSLRTASLANAELKTGSLADTTLKTAQIANPTLK
jgi:hypothetical protein